MTNTVTTSKGSLLVRGLSGLMAPRLSILIFHRVLRHPDPLFPDEPDALRFEALMRLVAANFRVMTLGEATKHMACGQLPPGTVVITFDDGYADNAEVALPILKKFGIPATFFVATAFLDGGRMWNDSVIECIRKTAKHELDLTAYGLGRSSLSDCEQRRAVIKRLLPKIKYLTLDEREKAIQTLQRDCAVEELPTDLMMTSAQVAELHGVGMEIGGHTDRHPILTSLNDADAEQEIVRGRLRLQEITGKPVDVFAYPNGSPGQDYEARHAEMLRRLGFRAAVSTAKGSARIGDDLWQLPRFTPWDRTPGRWLLRFIDNWRTTDYERAPAPATS